MGLAFDLSAGCLLRHLQKPEEQKPEQITVGVAMNHDYKLGLLAAMNGYHIMGRSYTSSYRDRYEKEGASATLWGLQLLRTI